MTSGTPFPAATVSLAPNMQEAISTYGFAAVLFGTLVEGEAVLFLAGFLAHLGYLPLYAVMVAGFAGTFASAQLAFHAGRHKGRVWLERWPGLNVRAARVFSLIRRNETLAILCFRLLYGFRLLLPFAVGASGVTPQRFSILNSAGGAVWAAAVACLGYYLSHTVEVVVQDIRRHEVPIVVAAAAGVVLLRLVYWLWPGRRAGTHRA